MTDNPKAAPMREDVAPGDRFRHVKRGTEYEVLGVAQLQTTDPLFDDAVMVVYRGDDGQLWTREVHEFLDRRFERLVHTVRPDAGDNSCAPTIVASGQSNIPDSFVDAVERNRYGAGDGDVERHLVAADYLIDTYRRLWNGKVVRDLAEAEGAWNRARAALAAMREAEKVGNRSHLDAGNDVERVCSICTATVASYPEGMCCHCQEMPWPAAAMREGVNRAMVETVEGVPDRELLDSMTEDYVRMMRSTLAAIESGKNEPLQILRDQIRNKFAIANAAAQDSEAA